MPQHRIAISEVTVHCRHSFCSPNSLAESLSNLLSSFAAWQLAGREPGRPIALGAERLQLIETELDREKRVDELQQKWAEVGQLSCPRAQAVIRCPGPGLLHSTPLRGTSSPVSVPQTAERYIAWLQGILLVIDHRWPELDGLSLEARALPCERFNPSMLTLGAPCTPV